MTSSQPAPNFDSTDPSSIPPAIPIAVSTISTSLASLSDSISVSSLLTDLTTALDSHHTTHLLAALQRTLSSLTASHSAATSEWSALSPLLAQQYSDLSHESDALTASLRLTQSELDALITDLNAAVHDDGRYFLLLQQRRAARDVSLLPGTVLLRVVSYLRPKELARALCVSHRWRATLDRGLHWKVLLVRVIIQVLHQRFAATTSAAAAKSEPPPPPTFTLTFTPLQLNPRPKSLLSKADALRHALSLHQRKVDVVMGEFESLSSKQGDESNEKSILRVMVDLKRDEVGRRRVMIGEMWEKAEALRVQRAAVARQLKDLERRISHERDLKRTMRGEHAEAQRWFEGRVSRVRAMEGGGQKKEERDGLIKKNGVLTRGVDGLRKDIEKASLEKREYEDKIAELKAKVKQVVW